MGGEKGFAAPRRVVVTLAGRFEKSLVWVRLVGQCRREDFFDRMEPR